MWRFALVRKGGREGTLTPVRFETADGVSILEGKASLIVLGVKHLHVLRHGVPLPVLPQRASCVRRRTQTHRPSLGETVRLQHRAVPDAETRPSVEHDPGVESHAGAAVRRKVLKANPKAGPYLHQHHIT